MGQAVLRDPTSVPALTGLVDIILVRAVETSMRFDARDLGRCEASMAAAGARAPIDLNVLQVRAYLLRAVENWLEAEAAYQRVVDLYPRVSAAVFMLGVCKLHLGRAGEALPLFEANLRSTRVNRSLWWRYYRMGQALQVMATS